MINDKLSKKVKTTYAPKSGDRIELHTASLAEIGARYSGGAFMISSEGYFFDENDCREAAEFFTKLADILKEVKANA